MTPEPLLPASDRPTPWHEDFYVGPPSSPIDVASFLSDALKASGKVLDGEGLQGEAQGGGGVETACDVHDLKDELDNIIVRPTVERFLRQRQDLSAPRLSGTVRGTTNEHQLLEPRSHIRKRKRSHDGENAEPLPSTSIGKEAAPGVESVRSQLDKIRLRIGAKLPHQAQLFIRGPRLADQNSLYNVLDHALQPITAEDESEGNDDADDDEPPNAVISVSLYTMQVGWPRGLRLNSKHELLSSNTLADLVRAVPCQSAALPSIGQRVQPAVDVLDRACVGMESVVYGRHPQDPDGLQKLMAYLKSGGSAALDLKASDVRLESVKLGSLSLRINYPYWIFHAGMCEHIWVIDAIHLHHRSEPAEVDYPLTTFLPIAAAPNCGVCKTLPAVVGVSGDIRLGESPCLVCKTCWDLLGWPRGDQVIQVVKLDSSRSRTR